MKMSWHIANIVTANGVVGHGAYARGLEVEVT